MAPILVAYVAATPRSAPFFESDPRFLVPDLQSWLDSFRSRGGPVLFYAGWGRGFVLQFFFTSKFVKRSYFPCPGPVPNFFMGCLAALVRVPTAFKPWSPSRQLFSRWFRCEYPRRCGPTISAPMSGRASPCLLTSLPTPSRALLRFPTNSVLPVSASLLYASRHLIMAGVVLFPLRHVASVDLSFSLASPKCLPPSLIPIRSRRPPLRIFGFFSLVLEDLVPLGGGPFPGPGATIPGPRSFLPPGPTCLAVLPRTFHLRGCFLASPPSFLLRRHFAAFLSWGPAFLPCLFATTLFFPYPWTKCTYLSSPENLLFPFPPASLGLRVWRFQILAFRTFPDLPTVLPSVAPPFAPLVSS